MPIQKNRSGTDPIAMHVEASQQKRLIPVDVRDCLVARPTVSVYFALAVSRISPPAVMCDADSNPASKRLTVVFQPHVGVLTGSSLCASCRSTDILCQIGGCKTSDSRL